MLQGAKSILLFFIWHVGGWFSFKHFIFWGKNHFVLFHLIFKFNYCYINLKRQSELSGLCPDTSSVVFCFCFTSLSADFFYLIFICDLKVFFVKAEIQQKGTISRAMIFGVTQAWLHPIDDVHDDFSLKLWSEIYMVSIIIHILPKFRHIEIVNPCIPGWPKMLVIHVSCSSIGTEICMKGLWLVVFHIWKIVWQAFFHKPKI